MSYWFSAPNCIRLSKRLTSGEKETYYALQERMTAGGYVVATNEELMKELGVNETALLGRLGALEAKNFIARRRSKQHKRIFYLRPPVDSEEKKPTEEQLEEKKKALQNAYKKGLFFGDVEPETLAERLLEVRYLEDMTDHSTQFVLTIEEIEYIHKFRQAKKVIDCQLSLYRHVDIKALIDAVYQSEFLLLNDNLTVKWLLENAEEVISGKYKGAVIKGADKQDKHTPNFKQRSYEGGMNFRFQSIDEVEV